MENSSRSPRAIAANILLVASLAVFGWQFRSLYTVPVFDSFRWGGDETWLMREYVHQMQHGVLLYPENFGDPVRTNGVLAGSMWGNALIYGLPGVVFFPGYDYGSIGRTVTALLALLLIGSVYFIARSLSVSSVLSAAMVLLMVASQGFVWATHSARYDLLTGLVLIWYCYYLSRIRNHRFRSMFIAGAAGILTICFSPHLLTLAGGGTLVFLLIGGVWRNRLALTAWFSGVIAAVGALSGAYYFGAGEFSLFGHGGKSGIFSFVLNEVPILRPFSRNVQVSNLLERMHLFQIDMPGMIVIMVVSVLVLLPYFWRSRRTLRDKGQALFTHQQEFLLSCVAVCIIAWLLMQGSRPYYLFHIVPLVLIGCGIILEGCSVVKVNRWFGEAVVMLALFIGIWLDSRNAIPSPILGEAIARDQKAVIKRFLGESKASTVNKSRILVDVAGLDRALIDTSEEVLTLDMFQPPPNAEALVHKLYSNTINYVILRSSPTGTPFEPGRALLPHVLASIGVVQDSAVGLFYDDGRYYDASMAQLTAQGLDTLRLYRIKGN